MIKDISVFIGLGTNIGDRGGNLKTALNKISDFILTEKLSSVYETEPVDYEDQDWFFNMVIQGTTTIPLRELLGKLQETENKMGRKNAISKGPRIIDLDILFYSNLVLSADTLIIPHPEIHNRSFVLTPLNEIAPEFVHPKLGKSINNLLLNLKQKKQVKSLGKNLFNDFINRQL